MKILLKNFVFGLFLCSSGAMAQDNAYDTNRGFVHPGGFHTQADFDRVKQQIADGNPKVTAAYQVLKDAGYAQSSTGTSPVEIVVRGGGNGENYMNAARGAATAYQNALRWKIEGNKDCAKNAVNVLMAWARTTKGLGGDSNFALAAGLYGYQFAQAAELMRDYEGWSRSDFEQFKQWMLDVWYPGAISFLRNRNGTWENAGKWWQAPGHYWSNWGLCNILCVASIGVLCDDVFIYNQAMSYFKYDQVGTYQQPRTADPIMNDGLVEFLGNLVVDVYESDLETGAWGKLGQMNESGRDGGHCAMALGLALDMAKIGWNQGDDLYAYMDHRLAAGVEYVAAQTQNVENLPWENYLYYSSGYAWTDGRSSLMTQPALPAHMRPYWGTAIGIYEGVKGVKMPFSEKAYNQMDIDGGGLGATSGGYDHLGYSVLMNTRVPQLVDAKDVPTELSGKIAYDAGFSANLIPSLEVENNLGNINGNVIAHNEMGGLVNKFTINTNTGVPKGHTLVLMPQLPDTETDTGQWEWNTGETTRNLTIQSDKSFIYRVTYTNTNGVKSQLSFSIAVAGDCMPTPIVPSIVYGDKTYESTNTLDVLYGKTVTLTAKPMCPWGKHLWSTAATTESITTPAIKEPTDFSVDYVNQGGQTTKCAFHLNVVYAEPYVIVGEQTYQQSEFVVEQGASLTLGLNVPSTVLSARVQWTGGTTGKTLTLNDVQESGYYTASFKLNGETIEVKFHIQVRPKDFYVIETGKYMIRDIASGKLLTAHSETATADFQDGDVNLPSEGQVWYVESKNNKHRLVSQPDNLTLTKAGALSSSKLFLVYAQQPVGEQAFSLGFGSTASSITYMDMDEQGKMVTVADFNGFPYELLPVSDDASFVETIDSTPQPIQYYTLDGVQHSKPQKGVSIMKMADGSIKKIIMKK